MHLYERKGLHGQILKIHIEHNNVEAALDTCRQFGPQDPNLWIQALQLIGNIEGKKVREEHIEEILQVNFKHAIKDVYCRGCQIGRQGPQLCAKPRHFCKLDVAASRMAFLNLNLHVLQVATLNSKN